MSPVDQLAATLGFKNEEAQRLYDAIFVAKSGDYNNIPITSSIEDFCDAIKWLRYHGYILMNTNTVNKREL